MSDIPAFERLIHSLSTVERKELLARIQSTFSRPTTPLRANVVDVETTFDLESEMEKLGLLKRLIFFLITLFTSRDREYLVKEIIFKRLRRRIDSMHADLIDFQRSVFRVHMLTELINLREGAVYFRDALAQTLGKERNTFVAFLAGRLLSHIQERLTIQVESITATGDGGLHQEEVTKKAITEKFNAVISDISADDRRQVYQDTVALHCLYNLSSFPFDAVIASFKGGEQSAEQYCDFKSIGRDLLRLVELLQAAQYPPSTNSLRATYLFHFRDKIDQEGFNLEQEMADALFGSENALSRIRDFNVRVPLVTIIRYMSRDLDYEPNELGGGEDWFVLFKGFWRDRIDSLYKREVQRKRREKLFREALRFLNLDEMPALNLSGRGNGIRYRMTLGFIKAFYPSVFRKMRKSIKLIYQQGEFYKEQNRRDYTLAVDFIEELGRHLALLESRLSQDGDLGQRLNANAERHEGSGGDADAVRKIFSEFDRDALALIDLFTKHLDNLRQALHGVLHGEPGDRFDTLSNIESLGGYENSLVMSSLKEAIDQLGEAYKLSIEAKNLE